MKLKAINYGQVWSDDRRIIIKKDRDYISYKEDNYALRVSIYRILEPHMIVVDCSEITGWFPPHHGEPLPKSREIEILKRIEEALILLKVPYKLENKPKGYTNFSLKLEHYLFGNNS